MDNLGSIQKTASVRKIVNRHFVFAVFGHGQYKDEKKGDLPSNNMSIFIKVQNGCYKGQNYFIATTEKY